MKIKSLLVMLLSLVLILGCLPATVLAADTVTFSVEADKTEISLDSTETINYTIYLDGADTVDGGVFNYEFTVKIPEGLAYVAGSGKIDDNFAAATGITMPDFNEDAMFSSAVGAGKAGYEGEKVAIMTFSCTVVDTSKSLDVTLSNPNFTNQNGQAVNDSASLAIDTSKSTITVDNTCAVHNWGEWVIDPEATCTTDGSKYRVCSACGKTETEVIPASHTWGDWTVTEATCTEAGSRTRTCSVCGETETEEIPAAGHTDINGDKLCDVCGKPAVEFEEKEDAVSYGIFTYTKAMLMRRSYVIEAEASEGGTITPEGDTTVPYMGAASYTIEPEEGYKIASITVDGKPVRVSGTYSFKNVTTNHTIEVVFAEK